ncbi:MULTISPECIES: Nif3-like dinuclear metal center hexameric protein [unclassified Nocardiopsis]|uniref:Nif3-like dinuclear metal center hexameric protein n=1 Tax=unclassified Nocardiopsis TaxID=2649073 RepID=UPI00066B69AF|nr:MULTISPECIES: Nif3-like dinuclear metal center hexameric protein [unclassified Nocardiopsis]MBQ1081446.1 Nif3-like dinuclear metal center hexameric protein [Nocardiopsis sp. B62]
MPVSTSTTQPFSLSDVTAAFEEVYPPQWAASWDAVGLVCGDPAQPVERVLFAVDPVDAVVDEAVTWGADLIITHHPLMLRGVTSVAANTPKGRIVHRLIRSGVALYTAHTNADTAAPGVSDALARAVGLTGSLRPLDPDATDPEGRRGIGRVGELDEPMVLRDFAARVAQGLPATAGGVRVAGDLDRVVTTVAVSGGAGDSLLGAARAAEVDAYVTSDLRHHPASEFVEEAGGPALVDTAHFASEWPWLADGAAQLADALRRTGGPNGANVETRVSTTVTDAWSRTFPHA